MFKFNNITRVLRTENDGEGNELGINSDSSAVIFAGAGTDEEWLDDSLGMFENDQDLSNLSDGGIGADKKDGDDEGDDEGEGGENDDEKDENDDDEVDENDDEKDETDDGEVDEKDNEDDDDEVDENDDENDDGEVDENDDGEVDENDDENEEFASKALSEFTKLSADSDALADALADASSKEFDLSKFKANNKTLYDAFDKANLEYQEAVLERDSALMADVQAALHDAQSAINIAQTKETSATGTSIASARAAVQAKLTAAIAKAGEIYPELDTASDSHNEVLVRLVNSSFRSKVTEGTSHVKAFVQAVEEVAFTQKLSAKGVVPKDVIKKTIDSKTKKSVKKRIDAAKKTPKRRVAKNNRGKRISQAELAKKSGDNFFKDDFVRELGIKNDDY